MAASDSSSVGLRSRVRRQEALAELGQRALEPTDLDGPLAREAAAARDALAVDGSKRMQEMIDGLLQYSRVDTQGDPLCPVDCDAVIDDVPADLEVRIDETDAEITVDPLPRVYGDPGQIRQLFQNLLENAITYAGDEAPRISVFAENSGVTWQVSVRDRGIGIDSSDTERLFQMFDRSHSHEEYDGTGIGLVLCRRIAERHGVRPNSVRPGSTDERRESVGGEISVDFRPGEGSTFPLALPTVPDSEVATERTLAREIEAETDSTTEPVTDE